MLKYYETTFYIFTWLALASFLFSGLNFFLARKGYLFLLARFSLQQPSLLLSAVLIVVAYHLFSSVLFFPVSLLSDRWSVFLHAFVPALVLFVSSGLSSLISSSIKAEYEKWVERPSYRTIQAYSLSDWRLLSRVVWIRGVFSSLTHSLPWLFSELIVVEAIFNAPGLGWSLWNYAKLGSYGDMLVSAASLVLAYLVIGMVCHGLEAKIGKRLEGYA